jgi:hypothetical protein
MGKRFELRIDHSGLKYISEQPNLNANKKTWLECLSDYDFDIKHIKGKENKVVHTLSRGMHLMYSTTICMHQLDLKRIILDVDVIDQHYLQVKEILQQENVHQKIKEYDMKEDGLLMHKNRIYVPSVGEIRNLVLKEIDYVLYSRHPTYPKTITSVRSQFFWLGLKKCVVRYISRCMECQRVKVEHRHPVVLLHPLTIPEKKWEVVTIDFVITL